MQRSTLVKHNDSKDHKHAVQADTLRRQLYDTTPDESTESTCINATESEIHLFRTTYFVAKENLPNSFVNSQLKFLKMSGVDAQFQDLHSDTINGVQQSLLEVIDLNMKKELQDAKQYGIIVDESTDLSVNKNLIMYIRYVHSATGEIITKLVGNVRIPDGTAATIVREVIQKLKVLGLQTVNLVGLGSDGASVMFGCKGGVGKLLREHAPHMTHIHCVAHRLALACSDAAKDIPFLRTYKDTLKNLYIHVTGSGVRTYKLESMQQIMEEPHLKLKDPISIRWLSMENAVKVIHRCYGSIVAYLQSNEGKNTVGDNVAEGLLRDVLHYKFPAFTALLADILGVVGVLCRSLQAESLDVSQLDALCESTLGKLEGLTTINGKHTQEFLDSVTTTGSKKYIKGIPLTHANEKTQMEKLKTDYIGSVSTHITNRLQNETTPILKSFSVLEPQGLDVLSEDEVTDNLKSLSEFYDVPLEELNREFCGIRVLMKGSYKQMDMKTFTKMVLRRHVSEYPLSAKLLMAAMCIPVTSVSCERGFSLQNRIKVKSRTSLTPENLDILMKLSTGPDLDSFPYQQAIRHWHMEKKRRLLRLYLPSKK